MVFIINPFSGKIKIKSALLDVVRLFNEAGYNVNIKTTQYSGHAIELAENVPDGTDIVVVSGGDGTLNEVVTGLINSKKVLPVGYIPTGSTNDFAATMGIPTTPKEAAQAIIDGEGFSVDVGNFNGKRYFSYIASFGLFTAVSYKTSQKFKNTFGHFAYVIEGVKDITKIKSYHVIVETEYCKMEDDYIFGSVTNTTSVGGIVKFSADVVKMNDGLFEVVLVKKPKNINDLSHIISGLTTSNFNGNVFELLKAKNIKFTFEKEINWSIDGEHELTGTEVEIENIQNAVSVIK